MNRGFPPSHVLSSSSSKLAVEGDQHQLRSVEMHDDCWAWVSWEDRPDRPPQASAGNPSKTHAVDEQQVDALLDALLDDIKGSTAFVVRVGTSSMRTIPSQRRETNT